MEIEDLGYNSFFEKNMHEQLDDLTPARVIAEFKEVYKVKDTDGEYLAKITGKQIFKALSREDYPATGDWVAISKLTDGRAVIKGILPRLTELKRKYKGQTQIIATNIDVAFVVEAVGRDYNLNRFERYFALAKDGGVKSVIILNKIDLLSEGELNERLSELKNRFPDLDIFFTSIKNNHGLDDLKKYIRKGKTYCFLGSSGVGKSSIINWLLGENAIKTDVISSYSSRGKHVTTKRQMYFLKNGGILIDNPGIREIGMVGTRGVESFFEEITVLSKKCRYSDCTHIHEPDCSVIKAVKTGDLDGRKFSNYLRLKEEAKYHELNDLEKKQKDHQFGKFINKVKKELKESWRKIY